MSSKTSPLCHFLPSKYTCLAYDRKSNLLAAGCETGEFVILGEEPKEVKFLSCPISNPVIMSFAVGKDMLLTVLEDKSTFYLWNFSKSSLRDSPICEIALGECSDALVTCVTWSQHHDYFFVGTDAGTVKILELRNRVTSAGKNEGTYKLVWGSHSFLPSEIPKESFSGSVIAIQEKKQSTSEEVLLVSSSGHCVVWSLSAGTCKEVDKIEGLLTAWWSISEERVVTARNDGLIASYYYVQQKDKFKCNTDGNYRISPKSPTYKIKPVTIENKQWNVYAVKDKPEEGIDESRILFMYYRDDESQFNRPIAPFGGRIVDFECLRTNKSTPALAVLTESELVILETEYNWQNKNEEFDSVRQSRRYPYLTSPVTCLQHCGLCTKNFISHVKQVLAGHSADANSVNAQDEGFMSNCELVATGHLDGSVRLWLCFVNMPAHESANTPAVYFDCGLVVYTADYFDFSQLDDSMKEITSVKVSVSKKYMNVVNKSNRALLFRLQQNENEMQPPQPQSQEVVLKDNMKEKDQPESTATLTSLPTPPFRPCQWQTRRVQLLQHFSCHYQSGHDQPLVPVPVNCVDYIGHLGLWVIGTDKGLVILDLLEKLLLDVIGSDKKLLMKSGLKISDHSLSADSCRVMCVKTISEVKLTQEDAQISLWVATASKALGVFTVGSGADVLQKTEMGKIKFGEIVDIFRCQSSKSDDVFVVAVTKEKIKSYVYPGGSDCEHKDVTIVKSGIVSDKDGAPHVIKLDSSNILRLLLLPSLSKTSYIDTPLQGKYIRKSDDGKVLFSSGGQHAVWCSERAVHCYYPF